MKNLSENEELRESLLEKKRTTNVSWRPKILVSVFMAILSLAGIYVLDGIKAFLWLVFLVISYPVLLSFTSSIVDGVGFRAEQLVALYANSLKALPILGSLIERAHKR